MDAIPPRECGPVFQRSCDNVVLFLMLLSCPALLETACGTNAGLSNQISVTTAEH